MMGSLDGALAAARREVDSVDNRIEVGSWSYDEGISRWCLPFDVTCAPGLMPSKSSWVLTVEDRYPEGEVRVWPAAEGGITDTYPHQLNNGLGQHGAFCRSGRLCLAGENAEAGVPDDADFKAAYFIERALDWMDCANAGTLMGLGEHLELPAFRYASVPDVIYIEDDVTKMMWDSAGDAVSGIARVCAIENGIAALSGFSLGEGRHEIEPPWGKLVADGGASVEAIWVLAGEVPSVKGWQAPNDFSQLREYLDRCGIDFDEVVSRFGNGLRDGRRHYFLIGVPIPENVGQRADHITWFAFLMPALTRKSDLGNGAKGKPRTLKTVDRVKVFAGNRMVDWAQAHNVAKRQLHSRGSLCESLAESDVLVIGAGSLGSLICEALVRGGVSSIAISDGDVFVPGNVSRHTLGFEASGKAKARELCGRMNSISPNVEAVPLMPVGRADEPSAADFDLIIDCTGSDEVIDWIGRSTPRRGALVGVFSFGIGAKAVYAWMGPASRFTREAYDARFADLVGSDMAKSELLPWEGTGCWSPVFPAQYADVAHAAAVCVKALDAFVASGGGVEVARLFEFLYDETGFPSGMRSVEL